MKILLILFTLIFSLQKGNAFQKFFEHTHTLTKKIRHYTREIKEITFYDEKGFNTKINSTVKLIKNHSPWIHELKPKKTTPITLTYVLGDQNRSLIEDTRDLKAIGFENISYGVYTEEGAGIRKAEMGDHVLVPFNTPPEKTSNRPSFSRDLFTLVTLDCQGGTLENIAQSLKNWVTLVPPSRLSLRLYKAPSTHNACEEIVLALRLLSLFNVRSFDVGPHDGSMISALEFVNALHTLGFVTHIDEKNLLNFEIISWMEKMVNRGD